MSTIGNLASALPLTGGTLSGVLTLPSIVLNGSTLVLGGNLTTSGAFATTFTMTAATSITFPTSGTLATVGGTVSSITGTANQVTASASTGAVTLALASNVVIPGTGGVTIPSGTTAQRAGAAGTIRFNNQTDVFELTTDGSTWGTVTTTTTAITSVTASSPLTSSGGTNPNIALTSPLVGTYGGTGVNNGSSTLTLGGNLTTSGAFASTFTMTAATSVTFPTSGTLFSTASIVPSANGGTGVNNGSSTITIGGNTTFSGAFNFIGNVSAYTNVTFPTSGTLLSTANPNFNVCEGRLTLTSGVPVTTADVSGGGTIYFTPYKGSNITLFDGTNWNVYQFSELSLTSSISAGQVADLFVGNSGTTLYQLAWTNSTTRATALTVLNGIYVLSTNHTRRYVGTFAAAAGGIVSDTANARYLWNYYNRVPKPMAYIAGVSGSTVSWAANYNGTTIQANGSSNYQINFVIGLIEDQITANIGIGVDSLSNAGDIWIGFGLNSTTLSFTGVAGGVVTSTSALLSMAASWTGFAPQIGLNYIAWLNGSAINANIEFFASWNTSKYCGGMNGTILC